jgi:hypothetical protein
MPLGRFKRARFGLIKKLKAKDQHAKMTRPGRYFAKIIEEAEMGLVRIKSKLLPSASLLKDCKP